MPKQKQNPEIADGFWCSQMPKQKQNPEIADGFWCSPSITEMDYGGEYIKYYKYRNKEQKSHPYDEYLTTIYIKSQ